MNPTIGQGMVYLAGERLVLPYKFVFCMLIIVATIGLVQTDRELANLTGIGTGVMLFARLPIMRTRRGAAQAALSAIRGAPQRGARVG